MKPIVLATLTALSLALLTACSSEPEQSTYCVRDSDGGQQIVDEDLCDGDHDGYMLILLTGAYSYDRGSFIKPEHVKDAKLINPGDSKARSAAGLPKSGTVKNGMVPRIAPPPAPARPAPAVRGR